MAGADFLKTSTGKFPVGATLEAAAVLLAVIEEADGRVGIKFSGGIRTTAQAASYLYLVDHFLGVWLDPTGGACALVLRACSTTCWACCARCCCRKKSSARSVMAKR